MVNQVLGPPERSVTGEQRRAAYREHVFRHHPVGTEPRPSPASVADREIHLFPPKVDDMRRRSNPDLDVGMTLSFITGSAPPCSRPIYGLAAASFAPGCAAYDCAGRCFEKFCGWGLS